MIRSIIYFIAMIVVCMIINLIFASRRGSGEIEIIDDEQLRLTVYNRKDLNKKIIVFRVKHTQK